MSRWVIVRPTGTITATVQSMGGAQSSFTAEINGLLGDAVTVKPANNQATLVKNVRGKVTSSGVVTVTFDSYRFIGTEQFNITVAPAPITVTDAQN